MEREATAASLMETLTSSRLGESPGASFAGGDPSKGDRSTTKGKVHYHLCGYPDATSRSEAKRQEHYAKYVTLVSPKLAPILEEDSIAKFKQLCSGWENYMGRREFIFPEMFVSIICRNALRCARLALQGGDLFNGRRADPNGRHRYGFSPLHVAAEMFNVDMVKLLLRHGASANVRTEGSNVIEGLLPLHVAVENASMHKFLEDHWEDGCPLDNLISLLCLPEMKMYMDTIRLIAKHTDNLINEVWGYINDDGKLVQLAILLFAAQNQLRDPINRSRSKVSLNGFDIIQCRTNEVIGTIHHDITAMVSVGKNGSALKKLKSKKEALITAAALVGIVRKAGEDLERCIQTRSEMPNEEILKHVSSILNNNGIVPSGNGIDAGNLSCYQYHGVTPTDNSELQVGTGESNEADKSSSQNAEGSKRILRKIPLKGSAINEMRNKFFPYWKSVLSARLNVHVVPSCELSMKDRKRMQGAEVSKMSFPVRNKSRGNGTLTPKPHFGSQFECRRQLCTVALTSLKVLRRA